MVISNIHPVYSSSGIIICEGGFTTPKRNAAEFLMPILIINIDPNIQDFVGFLFAVSHFGWENNQHVQYPTKTHTPLSKEASSSDRFNELSKWDIFRGK